MTSEAQFVKILFTACELPSAVILLTITSNEGVAICHVCWSLRSGNNIAVALQVPGVGFIPALLVVNYVNI